PRGTEDDVQKWRDPQLECARQGRRDVRVYLRLVEFGEYLAREALDAKAQYTEPGAAHGSEALGGHGVDAVGADELQLTRQRAAFLGGKDGLAQLQDAAVLGEDEDIVLENDRAHCWVRADDAFEHPHAVGRIEARDAGDAALGFVQEIRGRAERAPHWTVVERDQPHRADLGKPRLALGLAR